MSDRQAEARKFGMPQDMLDDGVQAEAVAERESPVVNDVVPEPPAATASAKSRDVQGGFIGPDGSVTRCVCGSSSDDGFMICCDKCGVWQHSDCVGVAQDNVPETYLCDVCDPRVIECLPKARRRRNGEEKRRRRPPADCLMQREMPKLLQRKGSSRDDAYVVCSGDSSEEESDSAGSGIDDDAGNSDSSDLPEFCLSHGHEVQHDQISSTVLVSDKEVSMKPKKVELDCGESSPLNSATLDDAVDDFIDLWDNQQSPWQGRYDLVKSNQYLDEVQALKLDRLPVKSEGEPSVGGVVTDKPRDVHPQAFPGTIAFPQCVIKEVAHHREGVVATADFQQNAFILEFKGTVMTQKTFCEEHLSEMTPWITRPCPYVLFFSGLPPHELVIDARRGGNTARHIRRSCTPNAEVRVVIDKSEFHLGIYALEAFKKGTEITIGFDFAYEKCQFLVECACHLPEENCPVAQHNRRLRELISKQRECRKCDARTESAHSSNQLTERPAGVKGQLEEDIDDEITQHDCPPKSSGDVKRQLQLHIKGKDNFFNNNNLSSLLSDRPKPEPQEDKTVVMHNDGGGGGACDAAVAQGSRKRTHCPTGETAIAKKRRKSPPRSFTTDERNSFSGEDMDTGMADGSGSVPTTPLCEKKTREEKKIEAIMKQFERLDRLERDKKRRLSQDEPLRRPSRPLLGDRPLSVSALPASLPPPSGQKEVAKTSVSANQRRRSSKSKKPAMKNRRGGSSGSESFVPSPDGSSCSSVTGPSLSSAANLMTAVSVALEEENSNEASAALFQLAMVAEEAQPLAEPVDATSELGSGVSTPSKPVLSIAADIPPSVTPLTTPPAHTPVVTPACGGMRMPRKKMLASAWRDSEGKSLPTSPPSHSSTDPLSAALVNELPAFPTSPETPPVCAPVSIAQPTAAVTTTAEKALIGAAPASVHVPVQPAKKRWLKKTLAESNVSASTTTSPVTTASSTQPEASMQSAPLSVPAPPGADIEQTSVIPATTTVKANASDLQSVTMVHSVRQASERYMHRKKQLCASAVVTPAKSEPVPPGDLKGSSTSVITDTKENKSSSMATALEDKVTARKELLSTAADGKVVEEDTAAVLTSQDKVDSEVVPEPTATLPSTVEHIASPLTVRPIASPPTVRPIATPQRMLPIATPPAVGSEAAAQSQLFDCTYENLSPISDDGVASPNAVPENVLTVPVGNANVAYAMDVEDLSPAAVDMEIAGETPPTQAVDAQPLVPREPQPISASPLVTGVFSSPRPGAGSLPVDQQRRSRSSDGSPSKSVDSRRLSLGDPRIERAARTTSVSDLPGSSAPDSTPVTSPLLTPGTTPAKKKVSLLEYRRRTQEAKQSAPAPVPLSVGLSSGNGGNSASSTPKSASPLPPLPSPGDMFLHSPHSPPPLPPPIASPPLPPSEPPEPPPPSSGGFDVDLISALPPLVDPLSLTTAPSLPQPHTQSHYERSMARASVKPVLPAPQYEPVSPDSSADEAMCHAEVPQLSYTSQIVPGPVHGKGLGGLDTDVRWHGSNIGEHLPGLRVSPLSDAGDDAPLDQVVVNAMPDESSAMKIDPMSRPLGSLPQPKSFEQRLKQARQSVQPVQGAPSGYVTNSGMLVQPQPNLPAMGLQAPQLHSGPPAAYASIVLPQQKVPTSTHPFRDPRQAAQLQAPAPVQLMAGLPRQAQIHPVHIRHSRPLLQAPGVPVVVQPSQQFIGQKQFRFPTHHHTQGFYPS